MKKHVANAIDEELARRGFKFQHGRWCDGSLRYDLRWNGEPAGNFVVYDSFDDDMHPACEDAYRRLADRYDMRGVVRLAGAEIGGRFRHKGVGSLAYSRMVEDFAKKGLAVAPDSCGKSGSTSEDAKRAWDSLVRRYPHERFSYERPMITGPVDVEGHVVFGKR